MGQSELHQRIVKKFKEHGMFDATDGSEDHLMKIRGLGNLYSMHGNDEQVLKAYIASKRQRLDDMCHHRHR